MSITERAERLAANLLADRQREPSVVVPWDSDSITTQVVVIGTSPWWMNQSAFSFSRRTRLSRRVRQAASLLQQ
jgi:hypothetical protein